MRVNQFLISALVSLLAVVGMASLTAAGNTPTAEADSFAVPARILPIQTVMNFRDLGGYATTDGRTTKWRTVFRSGNFARLSPKEQMTLSALNLYQVMDLRSAGERERAPSLWYDDTHRPETVLLPIGGSTADWSSSLSRALQTGDFTSMDMHASFMSMYSTVPLSNAAEYAALFANILASDGRPVLIHCTAGKDRTGIAAALLLAALNVPLDTIMQDFMLSNITIDAERTSKMLAIIFSKQSGKEVDPVAIKPLLTVQPEYLETSFAVIENEYGSVDNYLREALGLTTAKRKQLQQLLLD